jgi:hypothetical protein
MPTIVMKEAPDVDFYIGWSSVVEAPVWGGDRESTLTLLRQESDPYLRDDAPHHPERRLERADETGTSAMWVTTAGMRDKYPEEGSWEDASTIYMQRGLVSRANMFVLTRRILEDDDADVTDLLTPFEDEAEVRSA